jgi:hypothetical protein
MARQNKIDGQNTVRLDQIPGYRPGDDPFNPLGIGWYFDWSWIGTTGFEDIDFMPLVGGWSPGVHPTLTQIENAVIANPLQYRDGTTWLIGNEIIWDDERTPEQYAVDYHEFYYGIKAINPTYQIAIGSVITSVDYNRPGFTGTPIELLQAIRAAYQSNYSEPMPIDVWNIHPYVWTKSTVQEELDDLENQLTSFRNYMLNTGEKDKPLIITEYGLLNPHPTDWMIEYMLGSFDILESSGHSNGMPADDYRWVQRWAWFVMNDHVWHEGGPVQWEHCCLYDGITFEMKPLGEAYMNYWKTGLPGYSWFLCR